MTTTNAILYDDAPIHAEIERAEMRVAKLCLKRAGRPVVPQHGWYWCNCGRSKIRVDDPTNLASECCKRPLVSHWDRIR